MAPQLSSSLALFCAVLIFQAGAAPSKKFTSLEDMPDLKYGDPCSWEAEELRLNFTGNLLKRGIEESTTSIETFTKQIVRLGEPLCNALELTVCNKDTGKCDCGEPGSVLALGDKSPLSFTVEDDESGNQKCRFAVGAYCNPKDFMANVKRDAECAKGSSCLATDTRKECSFRAILIKSILNGSARKSSNFMKELTTGGYCSCKVDEIKIQTIDWTNSGEEDNKKYEYTFERRKRDASMKNEAYLPSYLGAAQTIAEFAS